jgi:hypothetical protein
MPLGQPAVLPIQDYIGYGIDFAQEASDFAADVAMPFFPVTRTSGWYSVPDARNFLRAEDAAWGRNGNGATRVVSQYGKDTYLCHPYGLEELVNDWDAKDWPGGPASMATQTQQQLLQRGLIAREVRVEAAIDAATFGTTSVSGTGQWGSTAANPRLDVLKASNGIRKKIGRGANRIILPLGVVEVVCGTQSAGSAGAAILDTVKYTGRDSITEEMLARYFNLLDGVVKFAVAVQQDVTKHTTRAVSVGLPEAGTAIWDQKEGYVFYMGTPGVKQPNFGTSFGTDFFTPDDYPDQKGNGIAYRFKQMLDEKIVCNPAMNVLTTVIA